LFREPHYAKPTIPVLLFPFLKARSLLILEKTYPLILQARSL
jgi:hypothetical protein